MPNYAKDSHPNLDDGQVVESELHAESFAKYFQDVEWVVRPVSITTCQQNSGKLLVAEPLPRIGGPLHFATQSVNM